MEIGSVRILLVKIGSPGQLPQQVGVFLRLNLLIGLHE